MTARRTTMTLGGACTCCHGFFGQFNGQHQDHTVKNAAKQILYANTDICHSKVRRKQKEA